MMPMPPTSSEIPAMLPRTICHSRLALFGLLEQFERNLDLIVLLVVTVLEYALHHFRNRKYLLLCLYLEIDVAELHLFDLAAAAGAFIFQVAVAQVGGRQRDVHVLVDVARAESPRPECRR